MKKSSLYLALLALPFSATAAQTELSTQTVKADFRHTQVQQLPEATTVVGAEQIDARSAEHLEQILSFAPNVNFSSGSSRGRYYLIRGIGERSQFIDPINPSVGLVIDGIDMTGLGAAATLFDVQQVEILRGPQGTRFGANALAGVINITSAEPTRYGEGYVSAKAGNYNSYGLGTAVSGQLSDKLQGRLAVHNYQSDGYMQNDFLGRKDTQDQNELLLRGKLAWQPSADSEVKFTYLYANVDNGYDVFTLDNSRNSLADEPGKDRQETHAASLNVQQKINAATNLEILLTGSKNDTTYSSDEDWVYGRYEKDPIEGINVCIVETCYVDSDKYAFSYFDQYEREFQRDSINLRLLSSPEGRWFNNSTDWVFGLYSMQREEELLRTRRKEASWSEYRNSLDVSSHSLYTELTTAFSETTRLVYGARAENWRNIYSASDNVQGETNEWLWGGKLTLEQDVGFDHMSYLSVARGYKAGGINSSPDISVENREFATEHNNTVELGLKSAWLHDDLTTRIAAFYIQRKNQQVKSSYVVTATPPAFQDYLANAAEGRNYGVELESSWQLSEQLLWSLSYGYLNTKFNDYTYETSGGTFSKTGRAQSHAPEHSGSTAITYKIIPSLSLRLEAEAKDKFYFSDSHDEQATGYVLYHARLSYNKPSFELALSGRNLGNIDTETRGFGGFGNDPRDGWAEHKYVQLGEPRLVMFEGKYKF